jgi:hypothetical protein
MSMSHENPVVLEGSLVAVVAFEGRIPAIGLE